METWVSLLQTFGLAVAILFFLAWCAIRAAHWAAPRIDALVMRTFSAVDRLEKFEDRINSIEQRIETLWDFQLRRASVEALSSGIAVRNSPIKVTPEAKEWMQSLAAELRAFYRKMGRTLSTSQLAEEIERRFGKEIVDKVCIPHGLFQGACLLIAMEVAKEPEPDDVSTEAAQS